MATTMDAPRTFIPGFGKEWLLPLYDPVTAMLGLGPARRALIEHAGLQPSHHVLDIGCGTGTLAVLVKRLHPEAEVTGLDPDAKALVRGSLKAKAAGVAVRFDRGFSDALPYQDDAFDRVFSSFMFHHLDFEEKEKTLREVRRVLKPAGRLVLLDFAGPDAARRSFGARVLHSGHRLADNGESSVIALMREAGLAEPKAIGRRTLFAGLMHIAYYEAWLDRG
jgi:ubiquinone/menaquinone biosynthesis C-methylase UbiE